MQSHRKRSADHSCGHFDAGDLRTPCSLMIASSCGQYSEPGSTHCFPEPRFQEPVAALHASQKQQANSKQQHSTKQEQRIAAKLKMHRTTIYTTNLIIPTKLTGWLPNKRLRAHGNHQRPKTKSQRQPHCHIMCVRVRNCHMSPERLPTQFVILGFAREDV
jgi:hypothetical protein